MNPTIIRAKRNGGSVETSSPVNIPGNARPFIMLAIPKDQEAEFCSDWYAMSGLPSPRSW
jgi:hypothetical protein